ncbi:MAG: hypothetical protein C5B43_03920 [Verrucomicrobia bacterium]|nr:MAG: hypothetical protein C5B43_03920 [Verrucomicrobiota bacterium]
MITTHKIFEKIQQDSHWLQKILIGGILMFIPIINFFALGYLYRYAATILSTGKLKLPDWEDWGKLFIEGLIFLGILFLYAFVPLLAAWLLYIFIAKITLGYLAWFPLFPVSIVLVIAPSLVLVGIFSIIKGKKADSLFLKFGKNLNQFFKFWKFLLIGNLSFLGLQFVGLPIYGLAFFIGFLFLIPYTIAVLNSNNKEE